MSVSFEEGQRIHIPGRDLPAWVTVDAIRSIPTGWKSYVLDDAGTLRAVELTEREAERVTVVTNDGAADSARVLAGLWTQ
jgi:hypothetical protein